MFAATLLCFFSLCHTFIFHIFSETPGPTLRYIDSLLVNYPLSGSPLRVCCLSPPYLQPLSNSYTPYILIGPPEPALRYLDSLLVNYPLSGSPLRVCSHTPPYPCRPHSPAPSLTFFFHPACPPSPLSRLASPCSRLSCFELVKIV